MRPGMARTMFGGDDLARLREAADLRGPCDPADGESLHEALREAAAVITCWGSPRFDEQLLAAAPHLRLIAHSAGTVKPHVRDAVFDRGILVTTAAAALAVPVAQYTVAMMVALLKQIPWLIAAQSRNDQEEIARRLPHVRELQEMEVGLVGASRVGREVIRLLGSYPNLTIRLSDPFLEENEARQLGVDMCSLDDVCRCEVVSIHAPNLPETRHMFDARLLSLLPDHAVFINTSRGALVDEAALVAEVRRRPLYALLDVTDAEPAAPDSLLRSEPNILLTPHIAGVTPRSGGVDRPAARAMGRLAIEEVLRFLRHEPLQHEVTREMLATQA